MMKGGATCRRRGRRGALEHGAAVEIVKNIGRVIVFLQCCFGSFIFLE